MSERILQPILLNGNNECFATHNTKDTLYASNDGAQNTSNYMKFSRKFFGSLQVSGT